MTRNQKIMTALAGAHLLLVACSAATLQRFLGQDPVSATISWYGAMSGGTNGYGFFKMVGTGCKVTFVMTDRGGRTWEDSLSRAGNREAEMRFHGSTYFVNDFQDDSLLKSWAATMFVRHPQAFTVQIFFQQIDPPTMTEYRDGERAHWQSTPLGEVFMREKDIRP